VSERSLVSTAQACIHLDALHSSRRIQHSSASIRTTLQYRLEASQFRQVKDFLGRHRYGKVDATVKMSGLHYPYAILRLGEELQLSRRQGNTIQMPVLIMKIDYN
jgi:hypothetical protein